MKKPRFIAFILLLFAPPVLYISFRNWIIVNWTWIEPLIALFTYWSSILFFFYISDIRFHFFVKRLLLAFKYDHTTWLISARYHLHTTQADVLPRLEKYLLQHNCNLERSENDFLKVLWNNKYLLSFRLTVNFEECQLHFYTTGIDVPLRQNKRIVVQLSSILESVENIVHIAQPERKQYEIDIEYEGKSPYYSYWVRKLPEEVIHDFNCSIKLPNGPDGRILVNKNHVIIRTAQLNKLFKLTQDYILLKAV